MVVVLLAAAVVCLLLLLLLFLFFLFPAGTAQVPDPETPEADIDSIYGGISIPRPERKECIYVCTTYFDFPHQDKWRTFCRGMDSLLSLHPRTTLDRIGRWLVVNEYSPSPARDWAAAVRKRYPFVDFLQKGEHDRGQPRSLNLVLRKVRAYRYWIHWEEAWYCRSPCLDRMFDVMDSTRVAQLQITQDGEQAAGPDWLDNDVYQRSRMQTDAGTDYYRIHPSRDAGRFLRMPGARLEGAIIDNWPLFSLRPSINRVAGLGHLEFSEDPELWPWKFEWDYARAWLAADHIKAVLPDGPVVRDNHISTHGSLFGRLMRWLGGTGRT